MIRLWLLSAVASLVALTPMAWGVSIRNMTTGELLFYDNFENLGSNVSHVDWAPNVTADFDPVASVGSWQINGGGTPQGSIPEAVPGDIQVTDFLTPSVPAPVLGKNYLRIDRQDTNSSAFANMTSPMTTAIHQGHLLRFETYFATSTLNTSGPGFSLVNADAASITLMPFNPNGTLQHRVNRQAGGNTVTNTNLTHSDGAAWDHVVLDYVIGSSTYQFSLNGVKAQVNGSVDLALASENFIPTEIVAVRFTAGSRTGSGGTAVQQMFLDAVPPPLDLEINRSSGQIKLINRTAAPVNIVGYELLSPTGALDAPLWTSIADNYDENSHNGSNTVDPDDTWDKLVGTSSRTELSEFQFSASPGNGATLFNSQQVSLGNAWIQNPIEDITGSIVVDNGTPAGLFIPLNVTYIGGVHNVTQIIPGDLNSDGLVNVADLAGVFASRYNLSTAGFSPAEQYEAGDFNKDGVTNRFDFLIWNQYYRAANPGAAALPLSAMTQVPEPGTLGLLALVALAAACRLPRRLLGLPVVSAFIAAASLLNADVSRAADLVAWWNLADAGGTTASDTSPTPRGGAANHGTLVNFGANPAWNSGLSGASDGITMPHGLRFAGGLNNTGSPATALSQFINLDAHVGDFSGLSSGTISVWYRRDAGGTPDDNSLLGVGGRSDNSYSRLHLENQTQASRAAEYVNNNLESGVNKSSTFANADDGNWHHLAYTSTGSSSKLYLDGVLYANSDAPFMFNQPWTRMGIGMTPRMDDFLWYFDGTLGDVRIYDEPLTQGHMNYLSNPANYGNGQLQEAYPLTITVNTDTGNITLKNTTTNDIALEFYAIESSSNSLSFSGWTSLDFTNYGGANVWTALGRTNSELSEGAAGDGALIPAGASISLGNAYNKNLNSQDLRFSFQLAGAPSSAVPFTSGGVYYVDVLQGDFNGDGIVNLADYTVWRDNLGAANENALNGAGSGNNVVDAADYALWKSQFGVGAGGLASVTSGHSAVPEPGTIAVLASTMLLASLAGTRSRTRHPYVCQVRL
ncbi:LamG-like jellyroll fold domain-containing protein [Aeoliella sp. SH292]|uniref:LamG-like jellyroll fold domain-containing protein n=1 Tax=Aeoliella sp. SH292 TaxID=3454464 RepID=UPI003F9C45F9